MNGVELCTKVKEIILTSLGLQSTKTKFDDDDKALAVGHIGRCQDCKGEFTPEQRGQFVYDFTVSR